MRVRLRQLEFEDLELLRDWRNSKRLMAYTREYRLLNMVNQQDWFERMSRDHNTEMFGIEADMWLVGACGLTSINWVSRTAEVSIYIGNPDYDEAGIEVLELLKHKAFDEFNLQKIYAEIYSTNYFKQELFKSSGFELEGILKRHAFKQGVYVDSYMFGLWRRNDGD